MSQAPYISVVATSRNDDHGGNLLGRTQIFETVWGYDFGPDSNALWVSISCLRSKLEADGGPRVIQTVRGLGYVLREEP